MYSLLNGQCSLPDNYTSVPAVACNVNTVTVTECSTLSNKIQGHLDEAKSKQMEWINHVTQLSQKEKLVKDYISWSAFYVSLQNGLGNPSAITAPYYHCCIKKLLLYQ